LALTSGLM